MEFALETNNLSKYYGEVRAVNSVNVRVKPGEIYGFLGLNGAGKTTTIRALLGMIRPSQGNVKVLDQAVGPNGRGPWAQVGHLVESPSAYPELTVRENLEISRRLHGISDPDASRRHSQQHPDPDGYAGTRYCELSIFQRVTAHCPID